MNITLSGTKVSMDGHTLAFQKNNLVDSMVITVDTDETWQYKLDVKYPCKDSNGKELYNVIDLTRVGNTCTAILQATMLPFNGKYTMQLRGVSGDKVYHTDTFDVWVKYSIDPGKVYDPVPSEFYQIEQAVTEQAANAKQSATESAESATNAAASATKAENAVVHSPIIGENGNWFIWDFEKSEYVDSGKSASTPPITPDTAGKYLTNDGSKAEWGVMSGGSDPSLGITGAQVGQIVKIMEVDTDGKPTKWEAVDDRLPSVSPSDVGKALSVEQIGEFEYGYGFTDIPNINTFIPLGITGASPGQFARIKFVDDIGQPKEWEAVDAAGGGETWELINEVTLSEDAMAVVFDKDKSGAAFALRKFAVVGRTKGSNASNTNGGVICINVANTPDNNYSIVPPVVDHGALKGDQLRYWHAAAGILAKKGWLWYLTGADNTVETNKATIATSLMRVTQKIPEVATYLSVWSRTSGSAFAAGSKIELYGVRA